MAKRKSITGGILAAAVTPRRAREHSIDLAASLELIDFLYEGGVDGIALLADPGEFVHFMLEDRARMLDFAVKRSRLPILVNTGHSTLDGAIYLGVEAAESGVAGVLLMPPYYFRYAQETVLSFCQRFAEVVAKEVPVYLYNSAGCGNDLEPATASELLASGAFAGIVDAGGRPGFFDQLRAAAVPESFPMFTADDRVFPQARRAGADGAVSTAASAVPELVVRLDKAITGGEHDCAARLEARLQEFLSRTERFPVPMAIKEALKRRGVQTGVLAAPLGEGAERDLIQFGAWFENWLPGALKECR